MGKNAQKKLRADARVAEYARKGMTITRQDALRLDALSNERASRQQKSDVKPVHKVGRVGYDRRVYQHRKGLLNRALSDTNIDDPKAMLYREVVGRATLIAKEWARLGRKVDAQASELVRLHNLHSTSDFMVGRVGRNQVKQFTNATQKLTDAHDPSRRTAIVNELAVAFLNAGNRGYATRLRAIVKEIKD